VLGQRRLSGGCQLDGFALALRRIRPFGSGFRIRLSA